MKPIISLVLPSKILTPVPTLLANVLILVRSVVTRLGAMLLRSPKLPRVLLPLASANRPLLTVLVLTFTLP